MTDIRGIELKIGDVVICITIGKGTFSTREGMVMGFTPKKVKVKLFPEEWERNVANRLNSGNPGKGDEWLECQLNKLKQPEYLVIK